jgi:hypothetical protein
MTPKSHLRKCSQCTVWKVEFERMLSPKHIRGWGSEPPGTYMQIYLQGSRGYPSMNNGDGKTLGHPIACRFYDLYLNLKGPLSLKCQFVGSIKPHIVSCAV